MRELPSFGMLSDHDSALHIRQSLLRHDSRNERGVGTSLPELAEDIQRLGDWPTLTYLREWQTACPLTSSLMQYKSTTCTWDSIRCTRWQQIPSDVHKRMERGAREEDGQKYFKIAKAIQAALVTLPLTQRQDSPGGCYLCGESGHHAWLPQIHQRSTRKKQNQQNY